jgi:predicted permease
MIKILIPFFFAYLFKKLNIFKPEDSRVFINYIIYFAIPSLAFKSAHSLGINLNIFKIVLISWLTTLSLFTIGLLTSRIFKIKTEEKRVWLLAITFGNTAFLGYPYTLNFFGEKGLNFAVVYDSLGSFIMVLTLGFLIAIGRPSLKELFSFPPLWALILGFLLKPYPLPQTLKEILNFLIPSVFPVILFAIGLAVSLSRVFSYLKKALFIEGVKIFLGGGLALSWGLLLGLPHFSLKVVILEASMPTMIFTIVLALKYKLNHHLAISCATLGILASFITAPFIVHITNLILK